MKENKRGIWRGGEDGSAFVQTHCREQNSSSVAFAICHRTPVPLLRCNVYFLSVYILSRSSLLMFSSVLVFPEGLYVFDFQDNEAKVWVF